MIFQTEGAIGKIIRGEKTQTRRIVKPRDFYEPEDVPVSAPAGVFRWREPDDGSSVPVFIVAKSYAVQPERTKPGVWWHPGKPEDGWYDSSHPPIGAPLRIRITAIRREDVRTISEDDARAEGYKSAEKFLWDWAGMHDLKAAEEADAACLPERQHPDFSLDSATILRIALKYRPAHLYDAWVLTFGVAS